MLLLCHKTYQAAYTFNVNPIGNTKNGGLKKDIR